MKIVILLNFIAVVIVVLACNGGFFKKGTKPKPRGAGNEGRPPTTSTMRLQKNLLIAVRGLRWDFIAKIYNELLRGKKSNIRDVAENGMHATKGIMPVFPTSPVPNLQTMTTGVYPEEHGIVADNFVDIKLMKRFVVDQDTTYSFDLRTGQQDKDIRPDLKNPIFGGAPIWKTIGQQKVACMFWPGCEFGGFTEGHNFVNYKTTGPLPWTARVAQVKTWMADDSIKLILIDYRDIIDVAAVHGPESDQMNNKLEEFDTQIGQLVRGLASHVLGQHEAQLDNEPVSQLLDRLNLNLIIVGTSGLHELLSEEPQLSENAVSGHKDWYTIWTMQPTMWLVQPNNMNEKKDETETYFLRTKGTKEFDVYYGFFHSMPGPYKGNGRIPHVQVVANPGYKLSGRRGSNKVQNYGDGYIVGSSPESKMRSAFVASGPALAKREIESHEMGTPNVHFLLCKLLKVKAPYQKQTFQDEDEERKNERFRDNIYRYFSAEFRRQ